MSPVYTFPIRSDKDRNRSLLVFPLLTFLLLTISCKKERQDPSPAVLQVFNAVDDNISFYTYTGDKRPESFRTSLEIRNKTYEQRNNLLYINNFPQPIAFYAKPDTMPENKPALTMLAELKEGAVYSLFLYGEKATTAFALFQDKIPAINRTDSTTHVRFANFSESQAISVNIKGKENGSLVANIPYKSMSDFIELDASKSVSGYEFEIRDQSTGEVLSGYTTAFFHPADATPGQWFSKSNTLVFTGKYGAANPNNQKITLMNHR